MLMHPSVNTSDFASGRTSEECSLPSVRVRVSFGGTSPRLRAIALDILGAVVPCPAPVLSNSPISAEGAAEGAPERTAVGDGRLPVRRHTKLTQILLACQCYESVSERVSE